MMRSFKKLERDVTKFEKLLISIKGGDLDEKKENMEYMVKEIKKMKEPVRFLRMKYLGICFLIWLFSKKTLKRIGYILIFGVVYLVLVFIYSEVVK